MKHFIGGYCIGVTLGLFLVAHSCSDGDELSESAEIFTMGILFGCIFWGFLA